ncbi:MAG: FitA-like ribbon-helix-helix domain-containing protein [bacterium]
MPTTITIKNISTDLYKLLKKNALNNHRSINSEVIAIIEKTLRSKKISPEDFIISARKLREKTKELVLTEDLINQAKNAGRP